MLQGTKKTIPYFVLIKEVMDQSRLWKFYFLNTSGTIFIDIGHMPF